MRARIKRWTLIAAGWFFVLLGIAGLFLPVLQGILFLLIGLLLLSSEYVWAHRILSRLRERFPKVMQRAHAVHETVHAWLHRLPHKPAP